MRTHHNENTEMRSVTLNEKCCSVPHYEEQLHTEKNTILFVKNNSVKQK